MSLSDRARVLRKGADGKLFTAAEAEGAGIHTSILTRLVREGVLERVSRGRYRVAGGAITKHHALAVVAAAAPDAVVCLISALAYHEIGTQAPSEVWIARARGKWPVRLDYPPVRMVHVSGEAFTAGVDTKRIEGRVVRIYSVPKTLADCFKFRNQIGFDVALEALTDAWRNRRFRMHELEHYARICRVENVMRPYLEALVA